MVHGLALSPMGELYKQAGLEVVVESTDAELMQRMLTMTSGAIGARE